MSDEVSKPAVKSLGMWGSVTSLLSFVYLLADALAAIPPDLISDTKLFIVGTIASAIALFGRWRAALPIEGIFFGKK